MYTDNALLFPHHIISSLKNARGPEWETLVRRIENLPECHEESLAFMLLMVRLNGCLSCETDSYRAMRGCTACTLQTLRRYKGTDADLLDAFADALSTVRSYAEGEQPIARAIQLA